MSEIFHSLSALYKIVSSFLFLLLVPSQPPVKVQALNKTSPTRIIVQWNPIPDNFYVHGILRGYKVLYKAIAIANVKLEEDLETKEVVVNSSTLSTVLENLNAFTRYEIGVLAFTVKGDGVKSKAIRAGNQDQHFKYMFHTFISKYSSFKGILRTHNITSS